MNICVLHGHPDTSEPHFCAALGAAYIEGAKEAGHTVSEIVLGDLEFDFLRKSSDFETPPSDPVLAERKKIEACDHLVVIFPLWMGSAPALLRGFLEQVARDQFLLAEANTEREFPGGQMKGKSARLVLTMGMPGLVYKIWFGAHSVKGLEQGIFKLAGFKPVHHTIYGGAGAPDVARHEKWLNEMREFGKKGI